MNKFKIPILISKINRLQKKILNEKLKKFNLESSQGIILYKIKEFRKVTPSQLVDMGVIEKAAVSKTLKKLENLGYILKETSLEDARSFFVSLTKSGEVIGNCVNSFIENLDKEFHNILSENSLVQLETIFENLEEVINKKNS